MAGRMKAYATRNPTATVSGATGTIVAGVTVIAWRMGIVLEGAEIALLALVVGWIPVVWRWFLDRQDAE